MRTLEEIDAKLNQLEIQAQKAKKQRFRVIVASIAMGTLWFSYFLLIFSPAGDAYREYRMDKFDDEFAEQMRKIAIEKGENPPPYEPKAGDKPNVLMHLLGVTVITLVFSATLIVFRPKRKAPDIIQLHKELEAIRKQLGSSGWEEEVLRMLGQDAPKKIFSRFGRIMRKHYVLIIASIVILYSIVLALHIMRIVEEIQNEVLGFQPFLTFAEAIVGVLLLAGLVVFLLQGKPPRSRHEARMEVLKWIVSETDEIPLD